MLTLSKDVEAVESNQVCILMASGNFISWWVESSSTLLDLTLIWQVFLFGGYTHCFINIDWLCTAATLILLVYLLGSNMARIRSRLTFSCFLNFTIDVINNKAHITRSEIPARLPLPRLYNFDTSWMQETADSSSGRKFFSDVNYNQGWYKRESIFFL